MHRSNITGSGRSLTLGSWHCLQQCVVVRRRPRDSRPEQPQPGGIEKWAAFHSADKQSPPCSTAKAQRWCGDPCPNRPLGIGWVPEADQRLAQGDPLFRHLMYCQLRAPLPHGSFQSSPHQWSSLLAFRPDGSSWARSGTYRNTVLNDDDRKPSALRLESDWALLGKEWRQLRWTGLG